MAVARKTFLDVWSRAAETIGTSPMPPMTVVVGETPFVKERLLDAAVERSGLSPEVFAQQPGEKDRPALHRLLDAWTTATLFGGRQLVIARDIGHLLKGDRAAIFEKALEGAPPHHLLATMERLDGRSRLAKKLKAGGGLIALPVLRDSPPPWHRGGPFRETDLNQWLVAEAGHRGLELDLAVADELTRRIGAEPAKLAQRVDQLALLLSPRTRLTVDDVAAHVTHSSVRLLSLYEDALYQGRVGEALSLADRMTHDGVYDVFMKLVTGPAVTDTVLRGLVTNLARTYEAHEQLTSANRAALSKRPWDRSAADTAALDEALVSGGRRVFLERDVRRSTPDGVRVAFRTALTGLRRLRDGDGASLHALTVRLARALGPSGAAS